MINIVISVFVALDAGFLLYMLEVHPAIDIPVGLIAGVGVFYYLSKRMAARLTKLMERVNKQAQKRNIDGAIETLKSGYKFRWLHPFVKSQIDAQIGTMYYYKKDYNTAFNYLKKGLSTHYIAKGMLAIIYMKKKKYDKMKQSFEMAVKSASKESLIWALYAYCMNRTGHRDDAISILNRGLKKLPGDERLSANLKALQNRKPMKMKQYGEMWYQFMLDKMPVIRQDAPKFARQRRR
ncbi:MAG: hypothetical protein GXO69_06630 [Acidobacteria bacterium]|nr:hypothetical protein [Acidobacteriota bacterium]